MKKLEYNYLHLKNRTYFPVAAIKCVNGKSA
jgi:hypothetical protein